jgi:hypothetical protein
MPNGRERLVGEVAKRLAVFEALPELDRLGG